MHTAILIGEGQAHRVVQHAWREWIKPLMRDGARLVLELREEDQSRDQQEMYHALIAEVAAQASHLGSKWGAEDWKRLLLDQFARDTGRTHGKVIPNLDRSGVVEVGLLSRRFSKKTAADFITWLHAWGAANGVEFSQ
jgi:hypothetical protein